MTQTMTAGTSTRLSPDQISFYKREGYLIYRDPVLPAAKFEGLKNHFEEKLARLPADVRPEAMDVPHFVDTKLFEWLFADEVLDLIEPILGPDIALFSSHFICKPRGNGKRIPWHEDSYYWTNRIEPMGVCTLWLAIDPSTTQNGCMNVIPQTFHGYSDYEPVDPNLNVFPIEIKKHQVDQSRKVAIELEPNQCSLHDARLMHGSDPNTSDVRRCGYTMRYISTRSRLITEKNPGHQLYLARGRDHAGNQYADPTHSYKELALYREKKGGNGH